MLSDVSDTDVADGMIATLCSPLPEDGDSGTACCWMLSVVSLVVDVDGMKNVVRSDLPFTCSISCDH